jgi:hypothetical protein
MAWAQNVRRRSQTSVKRLRLAARTLARAAEYIADFENAAERALRRPEWKGRRKLFSIYFLRGIEYKRAISLVGVSEGTFDYWFKEVKKAVGKECGRAGIFPPGRYFR